MNYKTYEEIEAIEKGLNRKRAKELFLHLNLNIDKTSLSCFDV